MVAARLGDDGDEGTMLHWMIADILVRIHGAIPPEGGLPPPDVPLDYKLPKNSLWIVQWCVRHVLQTIPSDWCLMVEVEMEWEFGRWINRGHADVIAISPDGTQVHGIDWKSVRVPVDAADNNWQVASYLILAKLTWPTIKTGKFDIAQPRVMEEDGVERISRVELGDLDRLIDATDQAVNKSLDNDMQLVTGKQCRWCIGAACFAIRAEQKYMEITMTPEMLATVKRDVDDATLGDFVIIGRRLKNALEDAQEILNARIDKVGHIVAGSGQVITQQVQNGSYSFPDPVEFFKQTKSLLKTDEKMALVMTPSITRIHDEISDELGIPATGNADMTAEKVFNATLRPLVIQGVKRITKISA